MSFKSTVLKERLSQWKLAREKLLYRTASLEEIPDVRDFCSIDETELQQTEMDSESRQALSRKVPISPSKIYPYRVIIILRLIILVLFLRYRLTHPIPNAHGLWLASVFCEVWFSISWFLDQLLKWQPVRRETYPERLCFRYNQPGKPSELASVDVFIGITDPLKESPLVISNTVLSVLSVDYPSEKVSCYVSDDGASLLILETLVLTCEFAQKWAPFCKKFNIEPRSPEAYFPQKVDNLKYNTDPTFCKERRLMKRQYEDFKIQINGCMAKFQDVPSEGWKMKDGTSWPGNDNTNHPGMIQILMGSGGPHGTDCRSLPQLVYVSQEKCPGFQHNKKAGAMNALVRVSAILTNGAYILNLDCDQYVSNSRAFLEAMCFMMDPSNKKICYVQFPQRFDGIDANDRYANHNTIFYDVNLKALDGIQGPIYVGTNCFFSRKALYGYDPPSEPKTLNTSWCGSVKKSSIDNSGHYSSAHVIDKSSLSLCSEELNMRERDFPSSFHCMEKCFGQSPLLILSDLVNDDRFSWSESTDEILREAIHVLSCDYEESTAWGREVGWIYGSQTGDILTGFKMHARGWRSVYCMPARAAFRGSAPTNLSDRLTQVLLWATGSIEILFSRHCPIWYGFGGQLKLLERVAYISGTIYPLTSIPLLIYCALPAVCLLTGKFIISPITYQASIWIMLILISVLANWALEVRWSDVSLQELWRNQQFWAIAGVSSHFFAVFQGLGIVVLGLSTTSKVPAKTFSKDNVMEFRPFKWKSLLVLPTALLLTNLWAMVAGISSALTSGYYASLSVLFTELFFASGVIFHLHPFLRALLVCKHNIPAIVILWSLLLAAMFSLLWTRLNPFTTRFRGPDIRDCGIEC